MFQFSLDVKKVCTCMWALQVWDLEGWLDFKMPHITVNIYLTAESWRDSTDPEGERERDRDRERERKWGRRYSTYYNYLSLQWCLLLIHKTCWFWYSPTTLCSQAFCFGIAEIGFWLAKIIISDKRSTIEILTGILDKELRRVFISWPVAQLQWEY